VRDSRTGLHGQVDLSGGSCDRGGASAQAQYGWGRNSAAVSADGDHTDRYLNPPVVQNFTNSGTTGDFAASYERDRLSVSVRHELSRFLVPNEQLEQAAGQWQDRDDFETMGVVSYQHGFPPNAVGDFSGMVRDNANDLSSNPNSTRVIAFQSNSFREGYFKATVSVHHGRQEWKAGLSQTTYSSMSASTIRSPTFRSSTSTHLPLSVARAIVLTSNSPHLFRT
jgi:hypothetical protein